MTSRIVVDRTVAERLVAVIAGHFVIYQSPQLIDPKVIIATMMHKAVWDDLFNENVVVI